MEEEEKHREPKSHWLPIACTVIVVLVAIYVGGYFALCTEYIRLRDGSGTWVRVYRPIWQADIYRPLTFIESAITGENIESRSWGE